MFEYTIIIVSLNTKKQFLKTINSIKKQKYKNYEVIIVDGLSKDGTIEEIKKIKKKNVKFIIEKDKGIYDAMNKGIRLSKGKWLIFMNSGDNFANVNVLKKLSKKNFYNQNIIFGDTIINHNFIKVYKEGRYFNNFTVTMPFCHQSTLVRAKLLKKNFFNLKYKLSSDFNFFLNAFNNKNFFLKYDGIISEVTAYGKSDIERQKVYGENIQIFLKKKFYLKILFLICLKFTEFIKTLIKLLLPSKLVKYILKLKYQKI